MGGQPPFLGSVLLAIICCCYASDVCPFARDGYYCSPSNTSQLLRCTNGVIISRRDCPNDCEVRGEGLDVSGWCQCDPSDCNNKGNCLGYIGRCSCKPGYFGDKCDKVVVAVVVPVVVGASALALIALLCYIIIALTREKGEFEKDIKEDLPSSRHPSSSKTVVGGSGSFVTNEEKHRRASTSSSLSTPTITTAGAGMNYPTPSTTTKTSRSNSLSSLGYPLSRMATEEDLGSKGRGSFYSELSIHDLVDGEDSSSSFMTETLTPRSHLYSSTEEGRVRPAASLSAEIFKTTVAGRPLFIPAAPPRSHSSRRHSDSYSDSDGDHDDSIEL